MQTNYFRKGDMGDCWDPYGIPEPCHVGVIPLNFDPTESYHTYTISWIGNGETCSGIKWYVDDTLRRYVWLDGNGYIRSKIFDESGNVIESSNSYKGSLPTAGSRIILGLWAAQNWDLAGQFNYVSPITAKFDWMTFSQPNCVPSIPSIPSGPNSSLQGSSNSYSTSATDPDEDQIRYTFNWGDGTTSQTGLVNSGTSASLSHTWSAAGTYLVKAMATDNKSAESAWSSALSVTITSVLNRAPNVPSIPSGPDSGIAGTVYSYSTSATDPNGDQVKYTFSWGDGTTTTTALVDSGTPASASHKWSTPGTYLVKARARDSKGLASAYSSSVTVKIAPNSPPAIASMPSGPASGIVGTVYSYSTSAIDPNGDQVKYTFSWGDGTITTTALVDSGTVASASHKWGAAGSYLVKAKATDSKGLASAYSSSLTVKIAANSPPAIAAIPSGPVSGIVGTTYSYSTSAIDPNGDQVKYTFSWGDGTTTTTALVDSGTAASASHKWGAVGSYLVKAKATDSKGLASAYSSSLTVKIAANSPPAIPSIPSGLTSGNTGEPYSYTTSATDPNGDQVKYIFSWGDGTTTTTGLVDSGTAASASHSWSTAGTYLVKARARDSKGATSALSSSLAVKIAAPGYFGNASEDQIAPIPYNDTDVNSSPTGVTSSLKNALGDMEAKARSQADQKAQELQNRAAQMAQELRGEA